MERHREVALNMLPVVITDPLAALRTPQHCGPPPQQARYSVHSADSTDNEASLSQQSQQHQSQQLSAQSNCLVGDLMPTSPEPDHFDHYWWVLGSAEHTHGSEVQQQQHALRPHQRGSGRGGGKPSRSGSTHSSSGRPLGGSWRNGKCTLYCVCRQPNDGVRPTIKCSIGLCAAYRYHEECVHLHQRSEAQATQPWSCDLCLAYRRKGDEVVDRPRRPRPSHCVCGQRCLDDSMSLCHGRLCAGGYYHARCVHLDEETVTQPGWTCAYCLEAKEPGILAPPLAISRTPGAAMARATTQQRKKKKGEAVRHREVEEGGEVDEEGMIEAESENNGGKGTQGKNRVENACESHRAMRSDESDEAGWIDTRQHRHNVSTHKTRETHKPLPSTARSPLAGNRTRRSARVTSSTQKRGKPARKARPRSHKKKRKLHRTATNDQTTADTAKESAKRRSTGQHKVGSSHKRHTTGRKVKPDTKNKTKPTRKFKRTTRAPAKGASKRKQPASGIQQQEKQAGTRSAFNGRLVAPTLSRLHSLGGVRGPVTVQEVNDYHRCMVLVLGVCVCALLFRCVWLEHALPDSRQVRDSRW
jgi:hypothetical protein